MFDLQVAQISHKLMAFQDCTGIENRSGRTNQKPAEERIREPKEEMMGGSVVLVD